jgi:phosphoenolpyruvate-protein kinase (PTS system EI component)
MRVERGKAAAPGFGDGRAFVYHLSFPLVPRHRIAPEAVAQEQARFDDAVGRAVERLEWLQRSAEATTESGGEVGHAAILARSLAIPYVTGVHDATARIAPGQRVLIDGQKGGVWVDPEPGALASFLRHKRSYDEQRTLALSEETHECVTRDGVRVLLQANIGRPEEVGQVAAHNLDGVGLFRTEYMFLDEWEPPSLGKRQFAEPPLHPVRFDLREILLIHARRAGVGTTLRPGIGQDVFSVNLVVQGVETIPRFCLRFRV